MACFNALTALSLVIEVTGLSGAVKVAYVRECSAFYRLDTLLLLCTSGGGN